MTKPSQRTLESDDEDNTEQEPSKNSKASSTRKKSDKSSELIVDEDEEPTVALESQAVRKSKSRSMSTQSQEDTKIDFVDVLEKEGVDLNNIIAGGRRKTIGGGSAPRNHARQPKPEKDNKRKRVGDDGELAPKKKPAAEGRYIARPKVR